MPPYKLPADKTQSGILSRSSPGGNPETCNELCFEDKKGQELVYLRAEKDQKISVEHDEIHWVGSNRTLEVDANEWSTIELNRTENVGRNETITIGLNREETVGANETITIGASRTESVGANESITIGENRTESVGGKETISNRKRPHGIPWGKNESVSIGRQLIARSRSGRTTR